MRANFFRKEVLALALFSFSASLALSSAASPQIEFVMKTKADLDGDGRLEEISLSHITEYYEFQLNIDGIFVRGQFEDGEADGLAVIDIDTSDRIKEVTVHTPGPSDDDVWLIYLYDGKSIKNVGRLSRWPQFPGNGLVYVDDWMGFWKKRDKYQLDRDTHTLKLVPQEVHYVGVEAKVKQGFPLLRSRDGEQLVASTKPGSKIFILACDSSSADFTEHWYLIKSESGLLGWARLKAFHEKVEGLPWAD